MSPSHSAVIDSVLLRRIVFQKFDFGLERADWRLETRLIIQLAISSKLLFGGEFCHARGAGIQETSG
jgi:hypothetical protein